jgi:Aldehyde dehydrogenase family
MNSFQELFDRQKNLFATGKTRCYGWRVEQLDRMAHLVAENEKALQQAIAKDFKTASQEQIFETLACVAEVAFQKSQLKDWMKPIEAPVPKAPAATGHRAMVYRDPYGVALIIGPFNGPLTLLLRPAISALAAGNFPSISFFSRAAQDQIQLNAFPLVFGGRSICGSLTGTAIDIEDMLAFSVLENIRPMIETVPLEHAADAYARMMEGKARFRMALATKNGVAQTAPVDSSSAAAA